MSIPEVNDNLLTEIKDEKPDEHRATKFEVQDQLSLAMHLNFVMETLLSLSTEQLAYFFLVFDC